MRIRSLRPTPLAALGVYLLHLFAFGDNLSAEVATVFVESKAVRSDVVEYVARTAAPFTVNVTAGQLIAEVVSAHCGRVDETYLRLLSESRLPGVPADIDAQTRFIETRSIQLPACLRLPQYTLETRIVRKKETPWTYFNTDPAGFRQFDDSTVPKAEDLPAGEGYATYLALFAALNPEFARSRQIIQGQEVLVPRSPSAWTSFEVRPEYRLAEGQVAEHVRSLLVRGGQSPETAEVDDSEAIKLYTQLTIPELDQQHSCQQTDADVKAPTFDPLELAQALAYDLSRLRDRDKKPDRAIIVIPDTGLYTTGGLPFSDKRITFSKEANSAPDRYAQIQPISGYSKHQHGTFVATLALGGPQFMEVLDSLGFDIDVSPVNLIEGKMRKCNFRGTIFFCPEYTIKPDALYNAIRNVPKTGAIVNLSIGRQTQFGVIEDKLGKDSSVLFIVAAGNDGRSLYERSVYPARYGGNNNDGRFNLITVAALDRNNSKRAAFSNHGEGYVDIAAPGCAQPVLEYDDQVKGFGVAQASGTSFATPLVSFTAALLRSVWLDSSPREIRRRILTSADILPDLQKEGICDGRRLNIIKALSLYQDVIQARVDGEIKLIKGKIDPSSDLFDFCGGSLSLHRFPGPNRHVIRKLAVVDGANPELLIYWLSADGVLERKTCPKEPLNIKIREDFTAWTYELDVDDILDIVFADA